MRGGLTPWKGMFALMAWLMVQQGVCDVATMTEKSEGQANTASVPPPQEQTGGIAPMSDPAIQGAACLGFATVSMATAYALGPVELLMLVSGAQHVPSSSSVLFIPMFSILGVGSCALAATATPSVRWLISQSDEIAGQIASSMGVGGDDQSQAPIGEVAAASGGRENMTAPKPIRPMTETEMQSGGCVLGAVSSFGAAMATSPMEVAMLSSGATIIVSNTPMLGMGLLATIVASGCSIGSFVAVPAVAFVSNFSAIGNSVIDTLTQGVSTIGGTVRDALGQGVVWALGGSSGATVGTTGDNSLIQVAGAANSVTHQ